MFLKKTNMGIHNLSLDVSTVPFLFFWADSEEKDLKIKARWQINPLCAFEEVPKGSETDTSQLQTCFFLWYSEDLSSMDLPKKTTYQSQKSAKSTLFEKLYGTDGFQDEIGPEIRLAEKKDGTIYVSLSLASRFFRWFEVAPESLLIGFFRNKEIFEKQLINFILFFVERYKKRHKDKDVLLLEKYKKYAFLPYFIEKLEKQTLCSYEKYRKNRIRTIFKKILTFFRFLRFSWIKSL